MEEGALDIPPHHPSGPIPLENEGEGINVKMELEENGHNPEDGDYLLSKKPALTSEQQQVTEQCEIPPIGIPTSFVCQQCDCELSTLEEFIEHMRTAHLQQPASNDRNPDDAEMLLVCPVCSIKLPSSHSNRKTHLFEHFLATRTSWKCQKCKGANKAFRNLHELREHFLYTHTSTIFRCSICTELFTERDLLVDHMVGHTTREQKFHCVACADAKCEFENAALFELHLQRVHLLVNSKQQQQQSSLKRMLSERKETSPKGGNKMVKKELASSQQQQQLQFPMRGLKCIVCDLQCPDELSLDQHRLYEHCKVQKGNQCAICREALNDICEFVDHCRSHQQQSGATMGAEISCIICRQSIRGDVQLRMHADYHLGGGGMTPDDGENQVGGDGVVGDPAVLQCPTCQMHVGDEEYAKHLLLHVVNGIGNNNNNDGGDGMNEARERCHSSPPTSVGCSQCGHCFDSIDRLNLHMLEHLSELIGGSSPSQLVTDKMPTESKSPSEGGDTKITNCHSREARNRLAPHSHKRRHQTAGRGLKCRICDKHFASQEQLATHTQTHIVALCEMAK